MNGNEHPVPLPDLLMFIECLGDRFRVHAEQGLVVELVLIEATALPVRGNLARPVPFSIVFKGPTDRRLPQRSFPFEHETLGTFPLFIAVPIAPDEQGPRYEAIFN